MGRHVTVKAEFTVHSFPTVVPSLVPSLTPTLANTSQPTDTPTLSPTVVNTPIGASLLPTLDPTFDPTTLPTLFPTLNPTLAPSEACFAAAPRLSAAAHHVVVDARLAFAVACPCKRAGVFARARWVQLACLCLRLCVVLARVCLYAHVAMRVLCFVYSAPTRHSPFLSSCVLERLFACMRAYVFASVAGEFVGMCMPACSFFHLCSH